jgi:hypothetical protein
VALGVPGVLVAVLALVALWRVGAPVGTEPGSTGTIGLNVDSDASLERVEVRQLTSDRTFWAGAGDDEPIFVVAASPVRFEPGTEVTIAGRVEAAPDVEAARREWRIDDATARAVRERGVYVRATEITRVR